MDEEQGYVWIQTGPNRQTKVRLSEVAAVTRQLEGAQDGTLWARTDVPPRDAWKEELDPPLERRPVACRACRRVLCHLWVARGFHVTDHGLCDGCQAEGR